MTTISAATSSEYQAELIAARGAAREAGALLAANAGRPHHASSKPDGSPITPLDLHADRIIHERLREAFPGDWIVTEESGILPPSENVRFWLVDPLDGTRDFAAGSPEFAVHVALVRDGMPVLAVVYQPATGAHFEAVRGWGAWRLEPGGLATRLTVSDRALPSELRLGISRRAPGPHLTRLLAETPLGARAVPLGASLKISAVAAGELDGTLCLHGREKSWDTAAPGLLVTEAGGRITDVDGRPFWYGPGDQAHHRGIVTSNGRCHGVLCDLAARYWPAHQ